MVAQINAKIIWYMAVDSLTFYPYPENVQEKLDALKEKNAKATKKYILSQRSMPFFSICV